MISLKLSYPYHSKRISLKKTIHIAIPKKIIPLAVRRNRLRRILREVLRKEEFFKEAEKPCLLIVESCSREISYSEVEAAVKKLI